jgi:hypothetical protein
LAEDAVGLKFFELTEGGGVGAFVAGVVGLEAVEGGVAGWGLEGVCGRGGELGFHKVDAAEVPGGMEEEGEGGFLEGAFRFYFGAEVGEEGFELCALVGADEEAGGVEAVADCVLGRGGFTLGGAGAGGELGIGAVGVDADLRRHEAVLSGSGIRASGNEDSGLDRGSFPGMAVNI